MIVVMDSPEISFQGQPTMETAHLADLGEVPQTHEEVRGIFPQRRLLAGQPRPCRSGPGIVSCCFPISCCYILISLHRGQAPPMEEVSAPGPEGAQEIIKRREPFNRGKSLAAHLEQLYPAMLRMPVEVRAEGKGEKYVV